MYSTVNINDMVKVKLTDRGREIHRLDWLESFGDDNLFQYHPPVEDSEGYSKWQMWDLMQCFGPYCTVGSEIPFDTNILIEVKWN